MAISECQRCGFFDYDWGCCTCPDYEMFYACPIESKKPENQKELEEMAKWYAKHRDMER